jgi:hypothetical protein
MVISKYEPRMAMPAETDQARQWAANDSSSSDPEADIGREGGGVCFVFRGGEPGVSLPGYTGRGWLSVAPNGGVVGLMGPRLRLRGGGDRGEGREERGVGVIVDACGRSYSRVGGDVVECSDEDRLSGVGSVRVRPVSILAVIVSSTSLSKGESVAFESTDDNERGLRSSPSD